MNAAASQNVPRREQLLALLVDGELHSGERLAERLHITRAAIWKLVHALRDLGVAIDAQHQGYRLLQAVEMYDEQHVRRLCGEHAARLQQVDCLFTSASTNSHVAQNPVTTTGSAVLCVAEFQQAGRGRRGRSWLAPFGEGICMSLGWMFDNLPPNFASLSLVVGVALTRVLRAHGAHEVGVKWPNDLLWHGRKLAGVLIEMRGEPDGQAQVVIGIGLNMHLSTVSREQLRAQQVAACDLHEVLGEACPNRNALVAAFTVELLQCLQQFAQTSFDPFMAEWQSYDMLHSAEVQVLLGEQKVLGVAQGVSVDGCLLVNTPVGMQRFNSGEVSLRARTD
ncbi:MAG: biotin--[acetyl-CoA-carboxylase] ligase [Steroidobacteraceae bacterium]